MGTVRILWLVPRVGIRLAELAESPIMLIVLTFAALSVNRRFLPRATRSTRLAAGFLALAFLIAAELTATRLRGISLSAYFASRDPISGTVYYLLLLIYALMPWILPNEPGRGVRR